MTPAWIRSITAKGTMQCFAFVLLLGGPLMFGLLGKPTEMGIIIVAASIALVFLDIDRFERVKGAGFEARMREKKVDALIAKETEPPVPITVPAPDAAPPDHADLDGAIEAVMNALASPKYTFRTFEGIAKDTRLPKQMVADVLAGIVAKGYATQSKVKDGPVWSLTEMGRAWLTFDAIGTLASNNTSRA